MSKARNLADSYTDNEIDSDVINAKAGRKNLIINGGFDVQQRNGTTGVVYVNAYGYLVDRWWAQSYIGVGGTGNTNVVTTIYDTGIPGVKNSCSFSLQSDGAMTTNGAKRVVYRIEDVKNLAGETATLSFYASSADVTSMYVVVRQESAVGVVINEVVAEEVTLSTTLEKKEVVMDFPTIFGEVLQSSNNISISFVVAKKDNGSFAVPDGEYGNTGAVNLELTLANVQLEPGSQATDFEYRSFGEELALCQRYYCHNLSPSTPPSMTAFYYYKNSAMAVDFEDLSPCTLQFPVTMRVAPSMQYGRLYSYNGAFWKNITGGFVSHGGGGTIVHDGGYSVGRPGVFAWIADAEL